MRQYLIDKRRVLTFPLGPDDPNLPDDLSFAATIMRRARESERDELTSDERARIASMMRHPSGRKTHPY